MIAAIRSHLWYLFASLLLMKGKLISLSVQYRCLHVSLVYRWSSLVLNQVLIFQNVVLNPFKLVSSWLSNSSSRLAQHNYHVLERSSAYSNHYLAIFHIDSSNKHSQFTVWLRHSRCRVDRMTKEAWLHETPRFLVHIRADPFIARSPTCEWRRLQPNSTIRRRRRSASSWMGF